MEVCCQTERILLRPFEEADAEAAKKFWGDEDVMRYCLGATSHDKLPLILQGYRNCHQAKGLSVYAVVEKATGEVIGACGFNISGDVQDVELIYHFARFSWGKGYATEAAKACLELARENGRVKRVSASVDPNNLDSHHILKKIGFEYAGTEWFEDTEQEESVYELKLG